MIAEGKDRNGERRFVIECKNLVPFIEPGVDTDWLPRHRRCSAPPLPHASPAPHGRTKPGLMLKDLQTNG